MTWKNNQWIKFLEGYCKGKNQIQDEYVRKVAKKLDIEEPLNIKFCWQEEILEKFKSRDNHKLIILTGTAGDGKTKLCRDIVEALDGDHFDEKQWNATSYSSTPERIIVKDFSELKDEKKLVIKELINILNTKTVSKPILIAVNDGILIEELDKYIFKSTLNSEKDTARKLKEIIEDKINLGFSQCENEDLIDLINLSKLDAKENMTLIFDGILSNPGWENCNGCEGKDSGSCVIYQKYRLLQTENHIKENLSDVILLLQLNNQHFTIRELLNLATNTLLADVPKTKSLLISDIEKQIITQNCSTMKEVKHPPTHQSESTIEVGFWGMNLGPQKMLNNRPFSEINKLGFGNLSSNYWDKLLRHKAGRSFSIPMDDNNIFDTGQLDSINIGTEQREAFIRRARIQLYCYQKQDINAFHLQKYTHFGNYQELIYNTIKTKSSTQDLSTIARLVLALNRVFHGRYISDKSGSDKLYVPEQGQGSITPISIFHGEDIREQDICIKKIKNKMSLTGARIEPMLTLNIAGKEEKISLTVELFDYLTQVSMGAPPNTTDPRLYKKLLIFRSKISTLIRKNRRTETYSIEDGDFKPVALEIHHG